MSDGTDWCIHYRGLLVNSTCEAGVAFADVKDETREQHYRYPCFKRSSDIPCAKRRFLTDEEAEERRAQSDARLAKIIADLDADICPWCQQSIERKEQVGRCVYATPCGHRLYQGRLDV